jgi:hypothetical protein
MADITYREAIIEVMKNIVLSVDGVEHAEVDRSIAINIDMAPMASAFVYAGPETRVTANNEATLGFETWDLSIVVELWDHRVSIESTLARIHQAVTDNRKLFVEQDDGLLPEYSFTGYLLSGVGIKRMGADPQYFEVDNEKKAMIIPFIARYKHTIGNMFIPQT